MSAVTTERRGDRGFTIVELLVVVVLMGVIGTIVGTTLIGAMRGTRQSQSRIDAERTVQSQLERIARDVRVADPIRAASGTSLTVDVYRNNTCQREQWNVASGRLTVTTTTYATWSACSLYPATATPTATATLTALNALGNGATPVFTYTSAAGVALGSPTPANIATVGITLTQNLPENRAPVTFTTSVGVRNVALA